MSIQDRLNSLTGKALGLPELIEQDDQFGLNKATTEQPPKSLLSTAEKTLRRNSLNTYIRSLVGKQKERNEKIAWFCQTVFVNGDKCNTVNGTFKGGETVRKTCSKCKQWRNNPLSIYEELIQDVIEELKKAGINTEGLEL